MEVELTLELHNIEIPDYSPQKTEDSSDILSQNLDKLFNQGPKVMPKKEDSEEEKEGNFVSEMV